MATAAFVTAVVAYFLGSIPTGYLVGRARGIDLRGAGSGNIGATNALRVLGKPAGIFVLLMDALKGWLGVALVPPAAWHALAPATTATSPASPVPVWLPVLGGLAAVLGHNYTCWLRFKGGKGIATSAGVLLGLLPAAFASVLAAFVATLALTRIVSLSSLVAAALLPFATWYWHRHPLLTGFSVALAAVAIYRHRPNIQRLLAGTEPRLGQPRPTPPPVPPAAP